MPRFSRSAQCMRSSEIRRLMSLAADPSVISFSGGMQSFPIAASKNTLFVAGKPSVDN